ncbi:MAG: hypothetical protein ACXIUZ_00755 [Lysobacteraceae bacterium]
MSNTQTITQARNELANYPLNDVAQALKVAATNDRVRLERMSNCSRTSAMALWAQELVEASDTHFCRVRVAKELRRIASIAEARRECFRRRWQQASMWAGTLGLVLVLAYLAANA